MAIIEKVSSSTFLQ